MSSAVSSCGKKRNTYLVSPSRARRRRVASPAMSPRGSRESLEEGVFCDPLPVSTGQHLKVCGPESIQTLRGRMFGREVALILCGEAHEDTIDLTRREGILDPILGWAVEPPSPDNCGFNFSEALATKNDITVKDAKEWAEEIIDVEEEKYEHTAMEGATLVFSSMGFTKGTAAVFPPRAKRSAKYPLLPGSVIYKWADTDNQAREFNKRRLVGSVPVQEQDMMIAERKAICNEDGFELFDDWLIRQVASASVHVEFIQEGPVSAEEVELHVEPGASAAPPAHECLKLMELDSEEEEEPHLGNGCYLDYLRRRTTTYLSTGIVHGIDPRVLGDSEDDNLPDFLRGSYEEPRFQAQVPIDTEVAELDAAGADWARTDQDMEVQSSTMPALEAWLGSAADLLYHAPHVKADYSPFLRSCVRNIESLWRFFEELYFGTVPAALAQLQLDDKTRSLASARSLAYRSDQSAALMRRPMAKCSDRRRPMPVRALPVDRYLKARGFDTPRTWIAGLAERLRQDGAQHMVQAAMTFYKQAVERMLADPKAGDVQGDNFVAWLRACHRDVFHDVDISDPSKLQKKQWVRSKNNPKSSDDEYHLASIIIPGFNDAFAEICEGRCWTCPKCGELNETVCEVCQSCTSADAGNRKKKKARSDGMSLPKAVHKPSTVRQRMLSKFIVDAFALRSVDLAMILKMATVVASAPSDGPTVVVVYAGEDHTDSVAKFWRSWGFDGTGLAKRGRITKEKDADSSCLIFPPYMHDVGKLFPLPADLKDVALKMAQAEEREERVARRPK